MNRPDGPLRRTCPNRYQIMKRGLLAALSVVVGLTILGLTLNVYYSRQNNLKSYAEEIEHYLHQQERVVESTALSPYFSCRLLLNPAEVTDEQRAEDLQRLQQLAAESVNLFFYRGDSLVFWTNNRALPELEALDDFDHTGVTDRLVNLSNGWYLMKTMPLDCAEGRQLGDDLLVGLVPVKSSYAFTNEYLTTDFNNRPDIPQAVNLSRQATEFPVRLRNGEPLFYLATRHSFKDEGQQSVLLGLFGLWFFAMIVLNHKVARELVLRFNPVIGTVFLVAGLGLIRLLLGLSNFETFFADLPTFHRLFNIPVMETTLGYLLVNSILMLSTILFFHREFRVESFRRVSRRWRFIYTIQCYASVIIAMFLTLVAFRDLVVSSGIDFDFGSLFRLNLYTISSILSMVVMMLVLFLFSNRMMVTADIIELPERDRFKLIGATLLGVFAIASLKDFGLSPVSVTAGMGLFLTAFHYYVKRDRQPLIILLGWLAFFSMLAALLLTVYGAEKDHNVRLRYAQELANPRDPYVETDLIKLLPQLQRSETIRDAALPPVDFAVDQPTIDSVVNGHFFRHKYLNSNYAYDVFTFPPVSATDAPDPGSALAEMNRTFNGSTRVEERDPVRVLLDHKQRPHYLLRLDYRTDAADRTGRVFLRVFRKRNSTSRVYTELLVHDTYKHLDRLDDYDFAIYRDGQLTEENGGFYPVEMDTAQLALGVNTDYHFAGHRADLIYRPDARTVVAIGQQGHTLWYGVSITAYIFAALVMGFMVYLVVGMLLGWLTQRWYLTFIRPSLRNRIEVSIVLLILGSFLFIGGTTWKHFRDNSVIYHEGRLERKIANVLTDTEHELKLYIENPNQELNLTRLVQPISRIHKMDVNIYDLKGDLLSSSDNNIVSKGIVAPKMGGVAYYELNRMRYERSIREEQIGTLGYKAAYVNVTRPDGEIIAYMGLPYYSTLRSLDREVSEFMSTLLIIYVLILGIAIGVAHWVAQKITKPLVEIGEKLKELKLGRNEPLQLTVRDEEVNRLVREYNRMIEKLEENTEQLSKQKMDEAWREMAKQVAHEIKNPLTPMKLSVQFLKMSYERDPEGIGPKLMRVTNTVIEQIDALARIATTFSSFAKMPAAENANFNLSQVVTNVYELFRNERADVNVTLVQPDEQFIVFADHSHVMRVVNNILKNAIQAIPDDRPGNVDAAILYDREERRVTVRIEDDGTGITEEMRDKVFVPNFTTKSSGTGLGLAISKKIIENAGGRIYFTTEVGVGTVFNIELPVVRVEEAVLV